jgi:D-glycero-alpha-D-manno-heptose-7-phosphate kinase
MNELVSKARIYYTGVQRSATAVLKLQDAASRKGGAPGKNAVIDGLLKIKEIGRQIESAIRDGDLDGFGMLMDAHWQQKRCLAAGITLATVDELYVEVKKRFGVLGGKIVGAGGGGFLLLYTAETGRGLDHFMLQHNMPRVGYFPSAQGARVVSDLSSFDDFSR